MHLITAFLFTLLVISASRADEDVLKWCRSDVIAENKDELGTATDVDICCRDHHFCSEFIEGRSLGNNLYNPDMARRYSCQCEVVFLNCLKEIKTPIAIEVGQMHFNRVPNMCFALEYPIKSCLKYQLYPFNKCTLYNVDSSKPKVYQWLDVPEFKF